MLLCTTVFPGTLWLDLQIHVQIQKVSSAVAQKSVLRPVSCFTLHQVSTAYSWMLAPMRTDRFILHLVISFLPLGFPCALTQSKICSENYIAEWKGTAILAKLLQSCLFNSISVWQLYICLQWRELDSRKCLEGCFCVFEIYWSFFEVLNLF